MSTDWFTSPDGTPRGRGGPRANSGGARPGAGRKRGGRNRHALYQAAWLASPGIQQQHIAEAQRFEHYMRTGDWRRARIAFEAGQKILEHTWPEPKSPPLEITLDQRRLDAESIFAEVEAGNLRPTDAASLLRIQQDRFAPGIAGSDPRELLADRLTHLIEARQAEPIRFHNPPSEEQNCGFKPQFSGSPGEPVDLAERVAELQARIEAATPTADTETLQSLLVELEGLAASLPPDEE